jgi:uncharacterized membrane protein
MLLRRPGPSALALAIIGRGVLALLVRDFALFWQPVPAWIPGPSNLAVILGTVLVAGGIGLFFPRFRKQSAWALAIYALVFVLVRGSVAIQHPAEVVSWESLSEAIALFAGVFLIAPSANRSQRIARALFGACCVVFGVSHFAYAEFTAGMVPSWLPARVAFVYATGVAHAAAGVAILIRRWDRLAAMLEACMLGLFVAVVHVPSLWMSPAPKWAATAPEQWMELLIALSVAGAAATVAESIGSAHGRSR